MISKKYIFVFSLIILLFSTGCLGLFPEDKDNGNDIEVSDEDDNGVSGEIESEDNGGSNDDKEDTSIDSQYYNEQPSLNEMINKHSKKLTQLKTYSYEYSINSDTQSNRVEVKIDKERHLGKVVRKTEQGTTESYYDFNRGNLYQIKNNKVLKADVSSEEINKLQDTGELIDRLLNNGDSSRFMMSLEGSVDTTERFKYETDNSHIEVEIDDNLIKDIELVTENTVIEKRFIKTNQVSINLPEEVQKVLQNR